MSLQQISGKQIRPGVIEDSHIKGKLSESVLAINWADPAHAREILTNKVITDYVQFLTPIEATTGISQISQEFALDSDVIPGVVVGGSLRFRTDTGDIVTHNGKEVKAIIDRKVGPGSVGFEYLIKFYESDGITPYTFVDDVSIDFMYPVKTTLWDAVENFASNERFVDGAIDVTSKMRIEQIIADAFGSDYVFTGNGSASLGETLIDMITRLTKGTVHSNTETPAIIDEVVTARGTNASVDERLLEIESNIDFVNDHLHGKEAIKLVAEEKDFLFEALFPIAVASDLKVSDDMDVYVNGQLQEETMNYTVTKDVHETLVTGFSFNEDLVVGDVISVRWTVYR